MTHPVRNFAPLNSGVVFIATRVRYIPLVSEDLSASTPRTEGLASRQPTPGGWNRIHQIVDDITAEVEQLRAASLTFRDDIVTGPGGSQILLDDPAGNPIELFQPGS